MIVMRLIFWYSECNRDIFDFVYQTWEFLANRNQSFPFIILFLSSSNLHLLKVSNDLLYLHYSEDFVVMLFMILSEFPFLFKKFLFHKVFFIYLLVLPDVNGRYISPFLLKSSSYPSYSLNPDISYSKPHLLVHFIWNLLWLTLFYWVCIHSPPYHKKLSLNLLMGAELTL